MRTNFVLGSLLIWSSVSCGVGDIGLWSIARNDARFLRYREPRFNQLEWKAASRKLSSLDAALTTLAYIKSSLGQLSQDLLEQLDEKTMANLEHLLLSIRECLAQTMVSKAWRFIKGSMSREHHLVERRLYKYGGDKWCSEFSGNQRPLSTTWPWSIRPSLAVIWGVCWMFEMKNDEYQWSEYWLGGGASFGESNFPNAPRYSHVRGQVTGLKMQSAPSRWRRPPGDRALDQLQAAAIWHLHPANISFQSPSFKMQTDELDKGSQGFSGTGHLNETTVHRPYRYPLFSGVGSTIIRPGAACSEVLASPPQHYGSLSLYATPQGTHQAAINHYHHSSYSSKFLVHVQLGSASLS
jgi:hypothetical protein